MESTEELQQLEITALRSIYAEDFVEIPPPKAWKDAARLPEFAIKVPHPELNHAMKIYFHLHTKFPRTYPTIACPTFTIQKPIQGLTNDQCSKLSNAVRAEAQRFKGTEMVFQIVTFAQDWIRDHVSPPIDVPASLAIEMNKRASDEERAKRQREAEEAEEAHEREARLAEELNKQILADAQQQQMAKEKQYKARNRANSEATAVPSAGDTPTESFNHEIDVSDIRFDTVKFFHPRKEGLGTLYLAEPVCDDVNATLPLELYIVSFHSQYYSTSQGKKKLRQVEAEVQRLIGIRHPNLLSVFAVKLTFPYSSGVPQLVVLTEQRPSMTLQDVLEDCDFLKEERASDYLLQILSALNAVHAADLVHRGINLRCIGLSSRDQPAMSKAVKLGRVGYYTRLLDLHRSNSFGPNISAVNGEVNLPEAWLSNDVVDSPLLYTRSRDLHAVGVVLLQMLLGCDVTERFSDPHAAVQSPSVAPALLQKVVSMLLPGKKNQIACSALLADLETPLRTPLRTPTMPIPDPKTPMPLNHNGSPEMDYFRTSQRMRHASRWKEDWEELELLGKGAFGSVVKARNKIDSRIYAVKKVLLRTMKSDSKIFREVNALSRLSHRFIVRYYTTWVETSEPISTASPDSSDSETGTDDGMTSVPHSREKHSGSNDISFRLDDLDDFGSGSKSSFPSIHFTRSSSPKTDEDDDSEDAFGNLFGPDTPRPFEPATPPPMITRTLYIQMEFVERQTLKERIAEGLSEDEAWRLFHQIVDALVHMSGLGILHRDIKLTNIFIDGKGDCKVGDFGLATSSLAAVDPSNVSPHAAVLDADMTLEVGTKLYIAPEVQSRKRGPRIHTKADLYSLGIVFFEMNYHFSTGSERIAVIEDLRKSEVFFPSQWNPLLTRQRRIITWLLQHDPAKRPTALELSQSPLLPPRLEDEYFKGALRLMSKPDSPHHQVVLSSLFNQPPRPVRGFLYDLEAELPEHAHLNGIVQERLTSIFRLHGAVDMEPPLLMPVMHSDDEKTQATFLDRHGDLVTLPRNILVPFARLAARENIKRIKRYHIMDIYRPNIVAGHPKVNKAAVFDIITPDLATGPLAAGAEVLAIANECLNSFPTLAQNYNIHVSHSKIVDLALNRIPTALRESVIEIINQPKSSPSQRRALLLKKGLLRSTADELEVLADTDEDIDALVSKLEKISPALAELIAPSVQDVSMILQHARVTGVSTTVYFHPLMLGNHHAHSKGGIRFEVVRKNKRADVLAAGGQYNHLISRYSPPTPQSEAVCATGAQIFIDKITVALASFQSSHLKTLVKEQRSFGFWSPRRCDVYVVSYHPGYLQDRLEVVSYLWRHNISADIMYESGLPDTEHENHVDICVREGILFTVYPRQRFARRDQSAFKVKSILKGAEYEVSRQDLIGWLQHEIAEQKRIDAATSGTPLFSDNPPSVPPSKDIPASSDVQLLLPGDIKKQRKYAKHIHSDKAFEVALQVKTAFQASIPVLAIDVPPPVFDAITRNSAWVTDDEVWRPISSAFPTQQSAYANQVREAVAKRKADHQFILLFAIREERVQLLSL